MPIFDLTFVYTHGTPSHTTTKDIQNQSLVSQPKGKGQSIVSISDVLIIFRQNAKKFAPWSWQQQSLALLEVAGGIEYSDILKNCTMRISEYSIPPTTSNNARESCCQDQAANFDPYVHVC